MEKNNENGIPILDQHEKDTTNDSQNGKQTPESRKLRLIPIVFFIVLILLIVVAGYRFYQGFYTMSVKREVFDNNTEQPRKVEKEVFDENAKQPRLIQKGLKESKKYYSSYTPNLEHYALLYFDTYEGDKTDCVLLFDGKEADECSKYIQTFGFVSNNGENPFYIFADQRGSDRTFVVNGEKERTYDRITYLRTDANDNVYAYLAVEDNGDDVLIVNGEKQDLDVEDIYRFELGPNGKDIAVACFVETSDGKKEKVILVNGEKRYEFQGDIIDLKVNKEGNIGFVTERMIGLWIYEYYVVVGGKEFGPFDEVDSLKFAGSNYGFVATNKGGSETTLYVNGESAVSVPKDKYEIFRFIFAPNGEKYFYGICDEFKNVTYYYFDNDKYGPYRVPWIRGPAFSNDGKNVAYFAATESGSGLFYNGELLKENTSVDYNFKRQVTPIIFSDDGNSIMYYGFRGDDLWLEVERLN